jgi:hypothetical protein
MGTEMMQHDFLVSDSSSRHSLNLTNCILFEKLISHSADQEMSRLLLYPKIECRVHMSWPLDPILSQMNPSSHVHSVIL